MPNKSKVSKKKKNTFLSPAVLIAMVMIVAVVVGLTVAIVGVNKEEEASSAPVEESKTQLTESTYYAEIEMEDGGKIVLELYADVAPITVANFKKLVEQKFYDGLTFHRVIEGFMIQGGDPKGDGTGGSAETIFGEFASNGFENNLSHTRGVISMARRSYPLDSASCQFFICHGDSTYLDGDYAAFGKVISGMDVVDRIAAVSTNNNDKPLTPVVIKTIRMIDKPAA